MGINGFTNPVPLGDLPAEWTIQAIDSLCQKVASGGTPLRSNPDFYQNGTIRWFKTKELNDGYLDDSKEKITPLAIEKTSAKLFPPNTVLMAMYGDGKTITSLGILRKESATNQACCALIADPSICNHRFLFYALQHHRNDFIQLATGGAQRNLSGNLIRNFAIKVPPLDEQKAIAQILGTLDDKIELNQQMNRTLEGIARALFKSWFIDFDPVRAKLDGRQPAGMDAETAALFPAEFEDSILGKIPKGWKISRLDDLVLLQRGFDLPKRNRTPGSYPILAASGPSGTHCEFKVKGPGVTTGRSGVLGNVFFVHEDFWPLNTSLWVKEFRHSRPIHAYHLLRDLNFEIFNAGSAVPTLNRNHVHGLPVVDAPLSLVEKFEDIVTPIFKQCRANKEQSASIASFRDTLLPKLLSGDICVKDAEDVIREVA